MVIRPINLHTTLLWTNPYTCNFQFIFNSVYPQSDNWQIISSSSLSYTSISNQNSDDYGMEYLNCGQKTQQIVYYHVNI